MNLPKGPIRKRSPRRNLVAIDGTLDILARLDITVHEKGRDAEPFDLHIVHKDAMREFVDCNDPDCFQGGFSLGEVVREMVRGRQEEFIGTSFCVGQLGDPEEPGPHSSCSSRFDVQATLRYR